MRRPREYQVRILYNTGLVQKIRARDFTCTYNGVGELVGVKWDDCRPTPLHIGANEITAVFTSKRWWLW